jgi:catechol 2,3-dioxygenase-like lactoylglutathione lyase family enzyme
MTRGQESTLRRLPGLQHTDHVGLTVPNLEEGIRFFVEVLGAEELYRSERGPDEEFMPTNFEVPADA